MSQPPAAAAGPPGATATASATGQSPAQGNQPAQSVATSQQSPVSAQPSPDEPQFSRTPRQLRQLMLLVVAGGLLFGLLGALMFAMQAQALARADGNTEQLIRIQTIQTDLFTADAAATNAFLVGGLEPPEQRAQYDQTIDDITRLITEAAKAQPADSAALAALSAAVGEYTVTIEQARANNRQGFPVGAQYLREAGTKLRADALPILESLVAANQQRTEQEMNATYPASFQIVGVVILIAFLFGMIWVARRFKRTINVGLMVGGVSLLLSLIIGGVMVTAAAGSVERLRTGSFAAVTSAAAARIEANNAKANESLTLIARGSGSAFEEAWQTSSEGVETQLQRIKLTDLDRAWTSYVRIHDEIRERDDAGRWDQAVELATGTEANSSNANFTAFDGRLAEFIDTTRESTTGGLTEPQVTLIIGAVLMAAGGIIAALFGRWGVAVRLREYR